MAPMVWSWHTPVEVKVATVDPVNRPGDATVRGQLISISRGLSLVRDLVISLNSGAAPLVGFQGLLLHGMPALGAPRQG